MASNKIIIVNHFTFCLEHGNELCYSCHKDYRTANNSVFSLRRRLSDKLGQTFEIRYGFDLDARRPINIYAYGVIKATHHRGPRASGTCSDHSKPDCQRCFDWVRLVGSEVTDDNFDGMKARAIRDDFFRPAGMIGATV